MHNSLRIYVYLINGEKVEIKSESRYASKKRAKKLAGAGNDCIFLHEKEIES